MYHFQIKACGITDHWTFRDNSVELTQTVGVWLDDEDFHIKALPDNSFQLRRKL